MAIDLSRFKVIHGERVLNAVALVDARMKEDVPHDYEHRETVMKLKWIDVLAINEDGNLVSIADEAWTFQFIPIVGKG